MKGRNRTGEDRLRSSRLLKTVIMNLNLATIRMDKGDIKGDMIFNENATNVKIEGEALIYYQQELFQIFISTSSCTLTNEDISVYFSSYGVVKDVRIFVRNGYKGTFGFVTFASQGVVRKILSNGHHNHYIANVYVQVQKCKEPKRRMIHHVDDFIDQDVNGSFLQARITINNASRENIQEYGYGAQSNKNFGSSGPIIHNNPRRNNQQLDYGVIGERKFTGGNVLMGHISRGKDEYVDEERTNFVGSDSILSNDSRENTQELHYGGANEGQIITTSSTMNSDPRCHVRVSRPMPIETTESFISNAIASRSTGHHVAIHNHVDTILSNQAEALDIERVNIVHSCSHGEAQNNDDAPLACATPSIDASLPIVASNSSLPFSSNTQLIGIMALSKAISSLCLTCLKAKVKTSSFM